MAEVTIDAASVSRLVNNGNLVRLLPPLQELRQAAKTAKPRRRCCGGGKVRAATPARAPTADAGRVVRQISSLITKDAALLAQVKKALGATILRIKYPKTDGSATVVIKR